MLSCCGDLNDYYISFQYKPVAVSKLILNRFALGEFCVFLKLFRILQLRGIMLKVV